MRLLHTSDWHLGRSLHRADLRDAQAAFIDHVVGVVRSERIDAVLLAGDVYDRAVPSVDAVRLFADALRRLAETGTRVVVISGNHDSAIRLGFGTALIERAGVHLRTDPAEVGRPVLFDDDHGPVAVYPVPYLEPQAVRHALPPAVDGAGGLVEASHTGVLGRAMACVRADLATRAPGTRSVVVAHAWVAGGSSCDSERDISVGGVGAVSTDLFADVDYVALGHLHRAQAVAPSIRYSGSPLPYSFSEAGQVKSSLLVELDAHGRGRVEEVPAPCFRRLTVLRGTLPELLTDPDLHPFRDDFLAAVLTDQLRPEDGMRRLQQRFPHALRLDWQPAGGAPDDGRTYGQRVAGRDDAAVAAEFVQHVRGTPPSAAEQALLAAALESARQAEGTG